MLRYLARRLLLLIPVLFLTSVLVFLFVRALPGGPAIALLGERATPETIEAFERSQGLDRPVWEQYAAISRTCSRATWDCRPAAGGRSSRSC